MSESIIILSILQCLSKHPSFAHIKFANQVSIQHSNPSLRIKTLQCSPNCSLCDLQLDQVPKYTLHTYLREERIFSNTCVDDGRVL